MKRLYTRVSAEFSEFKNHQKYLAEFISISELNQSKLSSLEIELFIGKKLSVYDIDFFQRYFKKYANLLKQLTNLQLIDYIVYVENLKQDLLLSLVKKIMYPLFLLLMAFITLHIFNFALLDVLVDYMTNPLNLMINIIYYLSFFTLIIIALLLIIVALAFKNPVTLIFSYNRLKQFKVFRIVENYYLSIFIHLLLNFYQSGNSTIETFKLINQFKSDPIISNLAYFLNSDLEDGVGVEAALNNMRVNADFKRVLLFAIKSSNFASILSSYSKIITNSLKTEISKITKYLYTVAYIYLVIIITLLYKVISLPISMLTQI